MATRKDINISGNYAAPHVLHALFIYVVCVLKIRKVGQNRILHHLKIITTIRHGVLISGQVEFIPTAVCSN